MAILEDELLPPYIYIYIYKLIQQTPNSNKHPMLDRDPFKWASAMVGSSACADGFPQTPLFLHVLTLSLYLSKLINFVVLYCGNRIKEFFLLFITQFDIFLLNLKYLVYLSLLSCFVIIAVFDLLSCLNLFHSKVKMVLYCDFDLFIKFDIII